MVAVSPRGRKAEVLGSAVCSGPPLLRRPGPQPTPGKPELPPTPPAPWLDPAPPPGFLAPSCPPPRKGRGGPVPAPPISPAVTLLRAPFCTDVPRLPPDGRCDVLAHVLCCLLSVLPTGPGAPHSGGHTGGSPAPMMGLLPTSSLKPIWGMKKIGGS